MGQEESDQPVGSVWRSKISDFSPSGGEVQPLQIGLGGKGEAIVRMAWYGFPHNIVGTAISKVIAGTLTYNVCAQVTEMTRNGVGRSGSSRNCGEIAVGGSIQADHRVFEYWSGATWKTRLFHSFNRRGENWKPMLEVIANL